MMILVSKITRNVIFCYSVSYREVVAGFDSPALQYSAFYAWKSTVLQRKMGGKTIWKAANGAPRSSEWGRERLRMARSKATNGAFRRRFLVCGKLFLVKSRLQESIMITVFLPLLILSLHYVVRRAVYRTSVPIHAGRLSLYAGVQMCVSIAKVLAVMVYVCRA